MFTIVSRSSVVKGRPFNPVLDSRSTNRAIPLFKKYNTPRWIKRSILNTKVEHAFSESQRDSYSYLSLFLKFLSCVVITGMVLVSITLGIITTLRRSLNESQVAMLLLKQDVEELKDENERLFTEKEQLEQEIVNFNNTQVLQQGVWGLQVLKNTRFPLSLFEYIYR